MRKIAPLEARPDDPEGEPLAPSGRAQHVSAGEAVVPLQEVSGGKAAGGLAVPEVGVNVSSKLDFMHSFLVAFIKNLEVALMSSPLDIRRVGKQS